MSSFPNVIYLEYDDENIEYHHWSESYLLAKSLGNLLRIISANGDKIMDAESQANDITIAEELLNKYKYLEMDRE